MTVERLLPGRPLPGLSNERPPIVVTKDGYHVGNKSVTRTQLARARGEYVYPTFVLDVEWENATDDERVRLLSLAERLEWTSSHQRSGSSHHCRMGRRASATLLRMGATLVKPVHMANRTNAIYRELNDLYFVVIGASAGLSLPSWLAAMANRSFSVRVRCSASVRSSCSRCCASVRSRCFTLFFECFLRVPARCAAAEILREQGAYQGQKADDDRCDGLRVHKQNLVTSRCLTSRLLRLTIPACCFERSQSLAYLLRPMG